MENQQEIMYKLQMFEQHMGQLQQQLQAVEQGIVDLGSLNLGLDDLVGAKDKETMSLIGKGIFAKTKLVSEELVVDVGEKNFVTKSIPETKKMIIEQIEKLNNVKEELNNAIEKVSEDFQMMLIDAQSAHSHECGECSPNGEERCDKCSSGDEEKCECGHSHGEEHECCGRHLSDDEELASQR